MHDIKKGIISSPLGEVTFINKEKLLIDKEGSFILAGTSFGYLKENIPRNPMDSKVILSWFKVTNGENRIYEAVLGTKEKIFKEKQSDGVFSIPHDLLKKYIKDGQLKVSIIQT